MTMSQFQFNLATPADDDQLGELLARTPMEGAISLAFARRPSYLAASAVDGRVVEVVVCRNGDTQRIIGMGSRAISSRFVNGESIDVGYLSGLRLRPEYRGRAGLLARGYRFFRKLHDDQKAPYYLTTIAADNEEAAAVLTSARAGLPIYHPCGSFHTLSLAAGRSTPGARSPHRPASIRVASAADRNAILTFLHDHGRKRQFFPVYELQDLFTGGGLLRGLLPNDILLAVRNGQIVGTLGGWNQRDFKQILILGYRGWLSLLRPVYNAWNSLQRRPGLPSAGSVLPVIAAAIPIVQDDCLEVFEQLLQAMLLRLSARGERLLLMGLHEADPFLPVARMYSGREYETKLYIVYWHDEQPDIGRLTTRVPYLELGCL